LRAPFCATAIFVGVSLRYPLRWIVIESGRYATLNLEMAELNIFNSEAFEKNKSHFLQVTGPMRDDYH
jgi:hypothetical protein